MDEHFDNILNSINQLPQDAQNKIFNFLLYKKSVVSQDNKELIEFMTASSERLKKWAERTDQVIDKCDIFFNELDK